MSGFIFAENERKAGRESDTKNFFLRLLPLSFFVWRYSRIRQKKDKLFYVELFFAPSLKAKSVHGNVKIEKWKPTDFCVLQSGQIKNPKKVGKKKTHN